VSERNSLAAATWTDRFARSGDRTSEVSRGHSSLETWSKSQGTSRQAYLSPKGGSNRIDSTAEPSEGPNGPPC
jgi:hypothetical protein